MGCGASAEAAPKKQYAFRVRLLGGLNLYNNGFGAQLPGTYTSAGRFDGASDPYVILECSGTTQKFESRVELHTQNPVWNQEFYFNTSTKAPILTLTVKDKDMLSKDDVLGTAKIPLNGLLTREKERNIWVPLQGAKAGGEIGLAVIEAFRTHITAKEGVDVKPMDGFSGSSDCYMTLQVGQQPAQQTAVKGWTLHPVWNQTFTFFVPYGIKSQVAMILYDKDSVGVDTNMGWHYEYFDGKPKQGPRELKANITGAQGRLEFSIVDDETLEDVQAAPPVNDEMRAKFPSELPTSCTFDVRVLGAYNLAVADHNFAADFASDVNSWGWHEFKEYSGTSDPFARVSCEGVTYDTRHINNTLEPVWNEKFRFVCRDRQKNSLSIEVLDHDLAVNDSIGAVKIPLAAMKPGRRQEIWSFLDRGRGEIGVEVVQHHQLHIKVVKCDALPAKDLNGMCDPYIKLVLGNTEYKTRVVRNDRNPWFEEDFRFCLPTLDNLKLRVECWDSDFALFRKNLSEDSIGIADIDLAGLIPGVANVRTVPLALAGKAQGSITVEITEEVPVPESALDELKKKGKEAFDAAMKQFDSAKEMVSMMKLPDFDKKEEAVYEVADPKLAPRPRFSRINVDVVALRKLKDIGEPYHVGVSLPLQGKRFKTKEYRGRAGADIGESFQFPVPSRLTGGLEFTVFESARHSYTEWTAAHAAKAQLKLAELNGGDGTIRGSPADDHWVSLNDGKGEVVVRVFEMFRFQIRVVSATGIKTDKEPYVIVKMGDVSRNTNYVSNDPKNRVGAKPGNPVWDEQFTFFSTEKCVVEFILMDLGTLGDKFLGKAEFDLNNVRRGVPHQCEINFAMGKDKSNGKLTIEVLEEEKMALLDRLIDAGKNAAKLAEALAGEVADAAKNAASNAASAVTGAIGGAFGKLPF